MPSIFDLTDEQLDYLRRERKLKLSATRMKPKMQFMEQQFELASASDSDRLFRLYRRHHPSNPNVFSVGLSVCLDETWTTLCRYNGSYHPHRNHIERNRLVGVNHIHTATARYIAEGPHPDGFAEQTDRYETIEGAFASIVVDCNITGILSSGDADPHSENLWPEHV